MRAQSASRILRLDRRGRNVQWFEEPLHRIALQGFTDRAESISSGSGRVELGGHCFRRFHRFHLICVYRDWFMERVSDSGPARPSKTSTAWRGHRLRAARGRRPEDKKCPICAQKARPEPGSGLRHVETRPSPAQKDQHRASGSRGWRLK